MQDIMTTIINNINQLKQQFAAVESELDYLYLEGDEDAIHAELESIQEELDKTSFINCTPHWLAIEGIGDLPPSGILPRVSKSFEDCLPLNGVRVRKNVYDPAAVDGLPDPVEGLTFIVPMMVRDALSTLPAHQSRPDVFAPDTGDDAIRNDLGGIIAVRGLVQ